MGVVLGNNLCAKLCLGVWSINYNVVKFISLVYECKIIGSLWLYVFVNEMDSHKSTT